MTVEDYARKFGNLVLRYHSTESANRKWSASVGDGELYDVTIDHIFREEVAAGATPEEAIDGLVRQRVLIVKARIDDMEAKLQARRAKLSLLEAQAKG